ncbi:hypothetical protein BJY04DRAFT_182487 [Aspergillus karnatakaensis]|uniref:putative IgE binding protein n=1 Tax=Aspergillus karnatakaensis TaxID=1810916 RepID=UPI003CCDECD9
MKLELISSLLPLLAAAAPAPASSSTPQPPAAFTVISSRSASPIHLLPLNAAGQSFYLGGSASTYCPLPSNCPNGTSTVFAGNGGSLSVTVPGGQQIYVSPEGALKFTQAHSANIPPGSSLRPFEYVPPAAGSVNGFGHYVYNGQGASGFMACPVEEEEGQKWQVFAALQNATVPGGDVSECYGFSAIASPTNQTGSVWQYI